MKYSILKYDPSLRSNSADIELRMENYRKKKAQLLTDGQTLADFASGYLYFGFHKTENG